MSVIVPICNEIPQKQTDKKVKSNVTRKFYQNGGKWSPWVVYHFSGREMVGFCHNHQGCDHCECPEKKCGHGPYVPESSPLPRPICHPDRPDIIGVSCSNNLKPDSEECGPGGKECLKCSQIFSGIKRSFFEIVPPPKRQDEILEDCHPLCAQNNCEHVAELDGFCCRCCTCRGCPTCSTENCHPCTFPYERESPAAECQATNKPCFSGSEEPQPCKNHPSGCYFIPK
ncbi:uncharacterized protein CDAR_546401 [Caerostris darwini]|uniref:Uncharacterized protein n=1 Tax=Caerostris darwini TaxID=1538125 RepID=A0AAV4QED4_9ARAC|nr:uncharacterized protein CDAR_546401 [Caerostris darwini]